VSKVTQVLTELATNRRDVVDLKAEEARLWSRLEELPDYILWKDANDRRLQLEKDGTAIRLELSKVAVAAFREGEHLPGEITIVMQRKVEFSNGILEWAKKNVPAMLVLDQKALTTMVLSLKPDVVEGMGVPALVIETPDIRVASDLSAVLAS